MTLLTVVILIGCAELVGNIIIVRRKIKKARQLLIVFGTPQQKRVSQLWPSLINREEEK